MLAAHILLSTDTLLASTALLNFIGCIAAMIFSGSALISFLHFLLWRAINLTGDPISFCFLYGSSIKNLFSFEIEAECIFVSYRSSCWKLMITTEIRKTVSLLLPRVAALFGLTPATHLAVLPATSVAVSSTPSWQHAVQTVTPEIKMIYVMQNNSHLAFLILRKISCVWVCKNGNAKRLIFDLIPQKSDITPRHVMALPTIENNN